jgi:AcrR family transcriptional regulator
MLDERFARRVEEIEAVIAAEGSDAEKALRAGDDFTRMLAADPEWQRLLFEFTAYAVRNDEFRAELVARIQALRSRIAAALAVRAEELGIESAFSPEQIATMTSAMANGFAVERLLEGDAVSDQLFGEMLMVFFAGIRALAAEPAR